MPGSGPTDADRLTSGGALLLALLVGTGLTALCYEVLWTRMFGLMFGVSILGVIVTVSSFMLGLGLGSLAASSFPADPRRALTRLALLEGGIALYALAMPSLMRMLDRGLAAHPPAPDAWGWLEGLAAMLALTPQAAAMGAAFPLAVAAGRALGAGIGRVYGFNTLGGVIGAGLPLALLPLFGWRNALWATAGLGLVLAAGFLLLSRRCRADAAASMPAEHGGPRPRVLDLLAYAAVGAAALMLQMVWTRIFGMVLLRTEYILAVLLMVFLAGIGLGSLGSRLVSRERALAWMPGLAALASVAGLYALPAVSRWAGAQAFDSLAEGLAVQALIVAGLTLPVTLILGAWLPLLARGAGASGGHGGLWYGVNCLGAAAGAGFAGLAAVPWLGAPGTLILAAGLLVLAGLRWAGGRPAWLALPLVMLLGWPVRALPPVSDLLPGMSDAGNRFVHEDAVSITHVIERKTGERILLSDLQRMDASSDPTAVAVQKNQARLPLLVHPGPKRVLFLGLGTGVTAAGSLPDAGIRERVAVELARGAILAAERWFAPVNDGVASRIEIRHDDARRYLRSPGPGFDVIVGDLFHPDMAGRANLLSRQQFERVRARLNPGGVFAQWIALNQFDPEGLKVVLTTFARIFPDNALFVDGYRLALIGRRDAGMPIARAALAHWQRLDADARAKLSGGEGIWTWLARYWGRVPRFDAPVQDEWRPVLEFRLPRLRYAGGVDLRANWRWLLRLREGDARAAEALGLDADARDRWRRARRAVLADVGVWVAELAGREREAVRLARRALELNPKDRWAGFALADRMFASLENGPPEGRSLDRALDEILAIRPDHAGALRRKLMLALARGDRTAADEWRARLLAVDPLARIPDVL